MLAKNPHRPLSVAEMQRRAALAAFLDTCSEDALIEEVLLPLFRQLGFQRITAAGHRDKALEYGKDICGAEETLLAYDLAARGWGVTHCPDVVAHHHPDPSPRTGRSATVRRNALLTAWLRRPLPYALALTRDLAVEARHDPHARQALARLPAALGARQPLPPHVEQAAQLLETAAVEATV